MPFWTRMYGSPITGGVSPSVHVHTIGRVEEVPSDRVVYSAISV